MATNQNLPANAFITTLNGKRCTAIPKASRNADGGQQAAATTASIQRFTVAASPALETAQASTTTFSPPPDEIPENTVIVPPPAAQVTFPAQVEVEPVAVVAAQPVVLATPNVLLPVPEEALASAATSATAAVVAQISVAPSQAPQDVAGAEAQPSPSSSSSSLPPPPPPPPAPSQSTVPDEPSVVVPQQSSDADTATPTAPAILPEGNGATQIAPFAQTDIVTDSPTAQAAGDVALFTTIGTAPSVEVTAAPEPPLEGTAVQAPSGMSMTQTIAIAGGVVGGLAIVGLVGFLVWFWRKRLLRKRRSTLLTPLGAETGPFGGGGQRDEKGAYVIDRGSLGPTPRSEKLKAAFGYRIRNFQGSVSKIAPFRFGRGSSSSPSVNMNRGNSQFMDPLPTHSRNGSAMSDTASRSKGGSGAMGNPKDRFLDWWSRLADDISTRLGGRNRSRDSGDSLFGPRNPPSMLGPLNLQNPNKGGSSTTGPRAAPANGQQRDFLDLFNKDDRQLDREAQRARTNNNNGRSTDDFFGLNLNFDLSDPFSDANAIRSSAKPAPLVVSSKDNPFSDRNAIGGPTNPSAAVLKPSTYVADVRRSRGRSVDDKDAAAARSAGRAAGVRPGSGTPMSPVRGPAERESVNSVDSFGTRRNKFRSDPFDLDRPELLGSRAAKVTSSNLSTAGSSTPGYLSSRDSSAMAMNGERSNNSASRRTQGRTGRGSFSSKYSSGMSMGDWSDPGPDVGPAATRWVGSSSSSVSSLENGANNSNWQRQQQTSGRGRGDSDGNVGRAL